MPRNPSAEDYRRDAFLFILFIIAFDQHSYGPVKFHQICIRYLNELEKMGIEIEGLSSEIPTLQTHAIREAIIQALHWKILYPVNGRFQSIMSSRIKQKILTESLSLTKTEKVAARRAAIVATSDNTATL